MTEEAQKRSNWQRPIAGPQRPSASKQVAIYGNSPELAYTRRSDARPITFTCIKCGQEKTEYRYPGFGASICLVAAQEEKSDSFDFWLSPKRG